MPLVYSLPRGHVTLQVASLGFQITAPVYARSAAVGIFAAQAKCYAEDSKIRKSSITVSHEAMKP